MAAAISCLGRQRFSGIDLLGLVGWAGPVGDNNKGIYVALLEG